MADFTTSTHRSKWLFSPQDLMDKYKAANQRARQSLEKYGSTRIELDMDGSLSYPEPQADAKDSAEKHSRPKPLKIDEEKLLRAFYEFKIQDVCDAFKFPRKIQATALIYFKRFYLQWSVMEHHPKEIMLTCIYTACKAEENHVLAEELGRGIEQDHHTILNNEMLVLQSLGFDLIVYAPYRALEGFVSDMEEFCEPSEQLQLLKVKICYTILLFHLDKNHFTLNQNEHLDFIYGQESSKVEIDRTMLTEAPLLFPPGQLALAALRKANNLHAVPDFDRYLESMISHHHPTHTIGELTVSLNVIDSLISKLETPTAKDMKHIDRKLKACRDPGSSDKSKKRKHRSKDSSSEMR